jgi:hypothetical protein
MRDWRKLKISFFVWAFCYQCRTGEHQATTWPLGQLEFVSLRRRLNPSYLSFVQYAIAHCKRVQDLQDCLRTLDVRGPMDTDADWDYALYLLRKNYTP